MGTAAVRISSDGWEEIDEISEEKSSMRALWKNFGEIDPSKPADLDLKYI